MHSDHSDGRLAPAEMVREAAARGIHALAIADHDVLSSLPEALAAGERAGVEIVPAIELTASWAASRRAVHVLGYFIQPGEPRLVAALGRARTLMAQHVARVLDAVRQAGGTLERGHLDGYRHRYAGGAALVFGMLERGVLAGAPPGTGMRLLRQAADEPRAYTVEEAIALVHGAGGVASLAHPARLVRRQPLLEASQVAPLAAAGFDALEAWQWIPGQGVSDHYQRVAAELGLLVSGGSDDHGRRTADGRTRLGSRPIPGWVLDGLRQRAAEWQRRRQAPVPA